MANKATRNDPKANGWTPKGFVNLNLSDAQVKDGLQRYESWDKLERDFTDLMANGYRVTFSHDGKTGATIASFNCKDEANENAGWLLTSFAPTWTEALALNMFKHFIVLQEKWGDESGAQKGAVYG